MRKVLYNIGMALSILFMLASCNSETIEFIGGQEATDGVPITLTFQTTMPERRVDTRTTSSIQNLTLLVFNEKHRYLYSAKAVLQQIEPMPAGIDVLPEDLAHPSVDNMVYKFTVTLMTSTSPRIIHFIADHNNMHNILDDEQQFEGADEGEVIPSIHSMDMEDYSYWQSFKFNNIDQHIFTNRSFHLLRDKARVRIENETSNFELKGFCLHNAPDRGVIAPYISKIALNPSDPREMYRDVLYTFPLDPIQPTIPSGIELKVSGDVQTNTAAIPVFEYSNSQADSDEQLSVIIYGKGNSDHDYAYYKLDFVRDIYADPENKLGFIGTERFDIVRNNNYVVKITSADGKGYDTYEEAVRNPASNNLFGSVELQQFSDISDGHYTLIVDNTNAIMTLPGEFRSPISFVGADLENPSQYVSVYLNGKECIGDISDDPYIDYAKYDKTTGVLQVNVTNIPTNTDEAYTFNVVATAPGSPVNILRTITLKLRKRYDFNLKLEDRSSNNKLQGEPVDVKFTIPGTLPSTLYPFDVYIAADQLSPLIDATTNDNLKILKHGKRNYYVYTVRTPSTTDQEITLHFQRTTNNKSCVVTAVSDNFISSDVILPIAESTPTNNRGLLTYMGVSYTDPKIVPSSYRTQLAVSGVSGVTATMAAAGYVEFSGSNWLTASGNLTLTATMNLGNSTVQATRTLPVSEWKQILADRGELRLNISEVTIKTQVNYRASNDNPYQAVPTNAAFSIAANDASYPATNITVNNLEAGYYTIRYASLQDITTPIGFTYNATIGGTPYGSNSIYLSQLIDNPVVNLSPKN